MSSLSFCAIPLKVNKIEGRTALTGAAPGLPSTALKSRPGSSRPAAAHVGVHDVERQVQALLVGEGALPAQAMRSAHLAMVGGEDDDGPAGELEGVQLRQDMGDVRGAG
jgi:hypothetical protein